MAKPFFIAIDGIDGTGKSTQAEILLKKLNSEDKKTILTKEPGGTSAGEEIRKILLNKNVDLQNEAELLLFCADRCEHQKKIQWNIQNNINIVCDRFLPSTYAYQVFGRGLDRSLLETIVRKTVKIFPDLTIILDMDPCLSVQRAITRLNEEGKSVEEGRFEAEKLSFFNKVRYGFLWYAEQINFGKTVIIDANCSVDDLAKQIEKELIKFGLL